MLVPCFVLSALRTTCMLVIHSIAPIRLSTALANVSPPDVLTNYVFAPLTWAPSLVHCSVDVCRGDVRLLASAAITNNVVVLYVKFVLRCLLIPLPCTPHGTVVGLWLVSGMGTSAKLSFKQLNPNSLMLMSLRTDALLLLSELGTAARPSLHMPPSPTSSPEVSPHARCRPSRLLLTMPRSAIASRTVLLPFLLCRFVGPSFAQPCCQSC
jgi:hypothetical protein